MSKLKITTKQNVYVSLANLLSMLK